VAGIEVYEAATYLEAANLDVLMKTSPPPPTYIVSGENKAPPEMWEH